MIAIGPESPIKFPNENVEKSVAYINSASASGSLIIQLRTLPLHLQTTKPKSGEIINFHETAEIHVPWPQVCVAWTEKDCYLK